MPFSLVDAHLTAWIVALLALLYIFGLFYIANWAERPRSQPILQRYGAWIYSLALAVYCTSWTYYGAVGSAVRSGWDYLPIYLGPFFMLTFFHPVLRKLLFVAKKHNVTSITDFISARYGKRHAIAAMTALLCLVVVVPYIALQLKAVASSYQILLAVEHPATPSLWQDTAFLSALAMTVFAILFGTRKVHLTEQNRGVMTALAFESLVKLFALMTLALAVMWWVLDRPWQILADFANYAGEGERQVTGGGLAFFTKTLLAMTAIFLLPRQFHVTFVENTQPAHLQHAKKWFSGYLVLVALVVLPIALAGLQLMAHSDAQADSYVLLIPAHLGWESVSALVFIGGFSAATSMIIIATLALATMISNDVVMPALLRNREFRLESGDYSVLILRVRRLMIVLVMLLSFGYYRWFARNYELAETGLLAFALIVQLAPAVLGGLYWRRGHAYGVYAGVFVGFTLWFYCLMLPQLVVVGLVSDSVMTQGPWQLTWLKPTALFGLTVDPLTHGVVWSLGLNIMAYILGSLWHKADLADRLQAVAFVKPNLPLPEDHKIFKKSSATCADLLVLMERFVGSNRVRESLLEFSQRNGFMPVSDDIPHPTLLNHVERELAGVIGSSSAAAMVNAVMQGSQFAFEDVVTLFDDTREAIQFSRKILFSTLENLSQGVSVVDRDLQLVAWNKKYLEMFQYPPGMVRVGRAVADVVRFNAERGLCGEGSADEHVAKRILHLKNGTAHVYQRLRPDGTVIEIRGVPIPGGGFVTSFTDITDHVKAVQALASAKQNLEQRVLERTAKISQMNEELLAEVERRRETENQLRQAKAEAEAANASKTRFLALASHDILQPLNAARLFAAALQPQVQTQGQKMLSQLENSLKATEDLMATLLDIARLDEGKLDIRSEPVDLNTILLPLVDEMQLLAEQKNIVLRMHGQAFVVQSHATYLRRIVQNILSNAIKYTPSGKVLLSCRQRGQKVWVEVRDTGPGLAHTELNHIFNDFYRVAQTAKGQAGVGLGLGVVQRMARALHHAISVVSYEGRGSCFRVELPLIRRGQLQKNKEQPISLGSTETAGLKILCVDDDKTNLSALTTLLEQWQLGFIRTEHDIWQLAHLDFTPDVLIIDYQLGQSLDGIEVYQQMRARIPKLHAILVTASPEPDLPLRCQNANMLLLTKPIKPAALRAALKSLKLRQT